MKSEEFIIPLNGLRAGKTCFLWHVGKEFFVEFDNSDILEADLKVGLAVEKSGSYIGIDCDIDGTATVLCDRCSEELLLPVRTCAKFSVKFGNEPANGGEDNAADGREVLYVPADEAELDMSQIIYDYSMLALPMHRVHPDGECNPEALKHLCSGSEMSDKQPSEEGEADADSPFAALKDLFKN